jgi:hypothetical protein
VGANEWNSPLESGPNENDAAACPELLAPKTLSKPGQIVVESPTQQFF